MAVLKKINKKLRNEFGEKVVAIEKNSVVFLEGNLEHWDDLVRAGRLAVHKKYRGVVNNIRYTGGSIPPMCTPVQQDAALEARTPDVLVVGAGITGCAIARELARYKLDVLLVDKEYDVALHASSRNDGMVHPGIDLKKGSAKHRYNLLGNRMYDEVCAELGVPFERTGQYLCFPNAWMLPFLYITLLYWKWLGIAGVKAIGKKELRKREPALAEDLHCALFFPTAGVVCPYNLTIAYAENAVQNGVYLSLNTAVLDMQVEQGRIVCVKTNRGVVYPRVVVNAAGVFADDVARMAQDQFYSIHPRKGTNSILDKKYSPEIVRTIASRLGGSSKTAHTKGGGIVSTVHGNVLVGPDAVETFEKEDFTTQRSSIQHTFAKQSKTSPALHEGEIITYFAGVRAPTYEEDFVVCKGRDTHNFIHAAGIQSPGLTAAPAIAKAVAGFAKEVLEEGGQVEQRETFTPLRKPIPHMAGMGEEERAAWIAKQPDYGLVVCRCEEVSRGEILDALRRPVPCTTVDGVKRRVRPGMGRCQGGFCEPQVAQIIAQETGKSVAEVCKGGTGSRIVLADTKVPMREGVEVLEAK